MGRAKAAEKIRFYCGKCGRRLTAAVTNAGRGAKCKRCGVRVPVPRKDLDRPQIRLYCPRCHRRIRAFAEKAGKQIQCGRCNEIIRLPVIDGAQGKATDRPDRRPEKADKVSRYEAASTSTEPRLQSAAPPVPLTPDRPEETIRRLFHRPIVRRAMVAVGILLSVSVVPLVVLHATAPTWLNVRLVRAAGKGDSAAVRLLLFLGADINAAFPIPQTPLHWAAMKNHKEVADLLIARGADLNMKDEQARTPLLQATYLGNYDMARLLIARGADVNAKDRDGSTPLYWAAYGGDLDTVERLVAAGAEVNTKIRMDKIVDNVAVPENTKVTSLDGARFGGHGDIVDFLRRHGGRSGKDFGR